MLSRSLAIAIAGVVVYGVVLAAFVTRPEAWPERVTLLLMLVLPCASAGIAIVLSEHDNPHSPRQARTARILSASLLTLSVVAYFILWAAEAVHRNLPRLH